MRGPDRCAAVADGHRAAMAAYVALGRVEGGRVHAVAWGASVPGHRAPADRPAARGAHAVPAPEARAARLGSALRDRWRTLREQWAMTTFYLFDPDSWR